MEIEDDTPSSLVRGGPPKPVKTSRLVRIAPVVAGSALVLVLGVAAYVLSSAPATPPAQQGTTAEPGTAVAPAEVRVSFASTPEGAEVFAEDGTSLGVTPLARTFPIAAGENAVHRFVFKLDGFMDEVIEEPFETASLKIHARMRAEPAGDTPRKAKPGDTDYKENPY